MARVFTLTPPWWGRADVLGLLGLVLAATGVVMTWQNSFAMVMLWLDARRTPAGLWRGGAVPDATGEIRFGQHLFIQRGWGWTRWSTQGRTFINIGPDGDPTPVQWVVEGGIRRELSKAECLAILEERAAANDTAAVSTTLNLPLAADLLAKARAGRPEGMDGLPMYLLPQAIVAIGGVTLAVGAALGVGRLIILARLRHALRLLDAGLCPRCRYTRAGLAYQHPCPECGADPAHIRAQAEAALGSTPKSP